jgi:hypothetical protein
MVRRLERLGIWLGATVGGVGLLYIAMTPQPDVPAVLLGVLYVLGFALLAVGLLGFASEVVVAVHGRLPSNDARPNTDDPRVLALEREVRDLRLALRVAESRPMTAGRGGDGGSLAPGAIGVAGGGGAGGGFTLSPELNAAVEAKEAASKVDPEVASPLDTNPR